jgi:hypothetical protein
MAGRFRSSRMNENVMEEGMKRGMIEMKDEMKGLLWKIERSRDISQEGLKSTVLKGFESMARVMENVLKGVGERLEEEGRRRDRGERELEEMMRMLEERMADKEKNRKSEERKREERMQGIERTLEEGKMGASKIEGSMQMLDQRLSKEEEGHRKDSAEVKALIGRVNELCKGKEDKERQDRQYMDERLEKAMADKERLSAVEGALNALEMLVEGKEADVRQAREGAGGRKDGEG